VVLGGDVHTHCVADLKPDFDDARTPVVATEFCGTSITSFALPQSRIDAARPWNPHVHYARGDQRGYVRFHLDANRLDAALRVVDQPLDPHSSLSTAARFWVDPKRPGALAG